MRSPIWPWRAGRIPKVLAGRYGPTTTGHRKPEPLHGATRCGPTCNARASRWPAAPCLRQGRSPRPPSNRPTGLRQSDRWQAILETAWPRCMRHQPTWRSEASSRDLPHERGQVELPLPCGSRRSTDSSSQSRPRSRRIIRFIGRTTSSSSYHCPRGGYWQTPPSPPNSLSRTRIRRRYRQAEFLRNTTPFGVFTSSRYRSKPANVAGPGAPHTTR
jgi:hypothetical protein